jgi:hypothetical protein
LADFKKLLYDKVVTVLNLNSVGLLFDGGYEFIMYNGIPHIIDQTSLNEFEYQRTEVIPVSEEYNQETPSVNATDRSDYICQYQVYFRLQKVEDMKTALNEFRDYFFTNKHFTLDGYNVGIKTVRGNKQSSMMVEGGNIYAMYKIDVYCTATKYGYIVQDSDIWKMRKQDITTAGDFTIGQSYEIITVGTTDFTAIGADANTVGEEFVATGVGTGTGTCKDAFKTLKLIEDNAGTQTNPLFSNATASGKGTPTLKTLATKLRIAYEGDYFTKHLYSFIMNKEDKDRVYDLVHIFDDETFEYEVNLNTTTRRLIIGGTVILDVDWFEADV